MSDDFDPAVLGGSVKRGIINPDLLEERAKCDFDQRELTLYLFGQKLVDYIEDLSDWIERNPQIMSGLDYYEMTREEKFRIWWERIRFIMASEE